ncbi:receptor-like protein kinase FERONIA [Papaver somniferum]|nr:receptor-like protein kinase FERONIA [Papaver somniferum]
MVPFHNFSSMNHNTNNYKDKNKSSSSCSNTNAFIVFIFCTSIFFFSIDSTSAETSTTPSSSYSSTDKLLINCGAAGDAKDPDGLEWTTDIGSKFAPSDSSPPSLTSPASIQDPSVPEIPFMTARVFRSEFTYTFPVSSGRKFVRLYFYPASYSGLNASDSLFSVTAGPYTLLSNFSASQTSQALNFAFIIKEFSIPVTDENERLNITFTPSSTSKSSYAFVNGIQVVSMPDIYSNDGTSAFIVGESSPFSIDNSTALENVFRLNVGGNYISPTKDAGLLRSWSDDSPHIFGAGFGVTDTISPNVTIEYPPGMPDYVAPKDVYATARTMGPDLNINKNYNLTWIFSIDPGFYYLVRLHFCEIQAVMTKINQRVFQIFINNQTAEEAADVVGWAGKNRVPVYKDYVVYVPQGNGAQQDMWLALHPNTASKSNYYDAILNGVEIFKINITNGSLAGPNPIPLPKQETIDPDSARSSGKSKNQTGAIAGGVIGGVAAISCLGCLILFLVGRRRRREGDGKGRGKESSAGDGPSGWLPLSQYSNSHSGGSAKTSATGKSYASSVLASNLCRHFSFAEIKAATKNFNEGLILGVGGFGKVYAGEIDGGTTKVAIKRGNPLSDQGVNEFQTEIEMLSKLRHRHLVSLIGYCEDNSEMILVYDHMAHGTLREHLYKTQNPALSWKQRLEICIGSARGLHYLHTGAKHTIIHRDVKTTNILLDEKWVAKVSDFGLSKTGPALDHTHVSTVVKGSFGYLDPEYFRRQQLTEKSDVYSFGVVLFEVLCARPALNPSLAKEQVCLSEWAIHCCKKGIIDQIVDPFLKGKIAPECLKKFTETAEKCLDDIGANRPSMGDVLWNLEFALQLQESAEENGLVKVEDLSMTDGQPNYKKDPNDLKSADTSSTVNTTSMSIGGQSVASEDSDGLTPSAVFSQIMNPKGR